MPQEPGRYREEAQEILPLSDGSTRGGSKEPRSGITWTLQVPLVLNYAASQGAAEVQGGQLSGSM
jgi:hypothetical protein